MASSSKEQKVQDDKCNKEYQLEGVGGPYELLIQETRRGCDKTPSLFSLSVARGVCTHSACRWSISAVNIFEKEVKKCISGSPQKLILHTNDTTRRDFPTKSPKDNGEMRYLEKRPCDKISECHRLF
ncbi:hypothetical protein TNCV_4428811 [Trichonephila clavipes]|nr:hypothetical protein TNCV_4428811 [Trichonephila clavipes]